MGLPGPAASLYQCTFAPCSRRAAPITTLLLASGTAALAQTEGEQVALETVTVTGATAVPQDSDIDKLPQSLNDTPQSIDRIDKETMRQQSVTSLQDALRYAPGITLNSGEGGAHGDNVNLRGFSSIDAFFLDGVRDPGAYTRDNFDLESVEVLEGPSSILFGNGSAGGVVNQASKTPTLAPLRAGTLELGTNAEARMTVDVNQPLGPSAALRLDVMGETAGVADRDYVEQRRWGLAPSVAVGLGQPTTVTLSYFHEQEDNVPDYGIPFLYGQPANVPRNLYYGLKDSDITQTDVNVLTAVLRHELGDDISLSDTLRYGNYWGNFRVSAPHFGNDFVGGVPAPGTPLADIVIYRDRPSSEGTQTYLTNHTDLIARFATGSFAHVLTAGLELGRQTTDYARFDNAYEGIDGIAPTPLLAPDPNAPAPVQKDIVSRPSTTADMLGVYAIDTVQLLPEWSLNLGARFDRYDTSFDDALSGQGFRRQDSAWSPKAALVWKPTEAQTYYMSYSTSFDPAVSFLTIAPDTKGPAPESAKTFELGAKNGWLGGLLQSSAALFRTESANVTVSDPDDPTLQELPGSNQRIQGVELSLTGHLTASWEVDANVTLLDPRITASATPGEVGRLIPGAARGTGNLWTLYDLDDDWQVGAGLNYVGHRFADSANTANIPSYIVWSAMAGYAVTDDIRVQANLINLTDERYYEGAYFSGADENHVIPGAGRTLTVTTSFRF